MRTVVNLMPAAYLRRQLLRRRAVQWGAVLSAVLLGIWCAHRLELREFRTLCEQLEAIAREGQPTQNLLREITIMRKQVNDLQHHERVAQELEQQRPVLPLLGLISLAARQSQGKLRVTDLRAVELQAIAVPAETGQNEPKAGAVTLVGISLDSPTVAEFHETLFRSGLFADVKLIKSNERKAGDMALYDYEVLCEL